MIMIISNIMLVIGIIIIIKILIITLVLMIIMNSILLSSLSFLTFLCFYLPPPWVINLLASPISISWSSNKSSLTFSGLNISPLNAPPLYTVDYTFYFYWALFTIRSSIVPFVISLYTVTFSVCPMRWARSVACASIVGFQSLS